MKSIGICTIIECGVWLAATFHLDLDASHSRKLALRRKFAVVRHGDWLATHMETLAMLIGGCGTEEL